MNDSGKEAPPLLRCKDLVRVYPDGDVQALRGVSLEVRAKESVAITGPSGCGKSTLLHLLGGLDKPTSGAIEFQGRPLDELDRDDYRAHRVGFVFQSFYLLPTLSSVENVQVPMFEASWPRNERVTRADRLLNEVGMGHRRDQYPGQLSVGERQRVAIARSLANEPELLLADEPTGNLDSVNQEEILKLLHRLRAERGLTLVMVTHSHEVAQSCGRVIKMRDGRIIDG
jgi:putative ABC transport system ATP-binding protein